MFYLFEATNSSKLSTLSKTSPTTERNYTSEVVGKLFVKKHLKLNHMQKILLSAISLIILGSILVGNFLLIAGCSSKQTSTTEVLKKYAAESLGEDDQLVVLGGGSTFEGIAGHTVYIDFRGSGSEKRYRARLYRDSFLSDWKREIIKLPQT